MEIPRKYYFIYQKLHKFILVLNNGIRKNDLLISEVKKRADDVIEECIKYQNQKELFD